MPFGDGTGPRGEGPRAGRRGGDRGMGAGRGAGRGREMGRVGGRCCGMGGGISIGRGGMFPRQPQSKTENIPKKNLLVVAVVDDKNCTGCGVCADVCPQKAISMNDVAIIDEKICNGCGICVEQCPNGAISLRKL